MKNKKLIIGIIVGMAVLVLLIYFSGIIGNKPGFLNKNLANHNQIESPNEIIEEELIKCVVGNIETMALNKGTYGGEINGIENIQLSGGAGSTNLCCSEGDIEGTPTKLCTKTKDNFITHRVVFELVGENYIKISEKIPQEINGQSVTCEYNFDNTGSVAGRYCF